MNRILRVKSLVPSIRANFSSTARRNGVFNGPKEVAERQLTMQNLGNEVHLKTSADKVTFPATVMLCLIGTGVTINRCIFLAYKK